MKFSREKPPNWNKIIETFPVTWGTVIVAYGDTVYCGVDVPPDKVVHEAVHLRQQATIGVDKWWGKYFEDISFRLSQELEACIEEAKWLKENIKDRNLLSRFIRQIHLDLSSPMYGKMITFEEVRNIIK